MEKKDFEKLVAQAYDNIPEKFRKKIDNVALTIEEEPTELEKKQRGIKEGMLLLGLYVGVPATARGENYGVGFARPDVIKIYQKSIEQLAGNDLERMHDIIQDTVWHEYAHYFGMSESEVREWENEKKERE
jgi:predicted Zn-dependent protease with MMP-like domain